MRNGKSSVVIQSRGTWLKESQWGAMVHFLADPPSSTSSSNLSVNAWNARVDAFDVEGLASQLEEAQAKYLLFTLGQCSGHFCSPNATYDQLTGSESGKCSHRDLIVDMHEALHKRGIRLLAYLPSHGPSQDIKAMRALKFTPPWDISKWSPIKDSITQSDRNSVDVRMTEAQRNWEAVIAEWSLRWGHKVEGWWFDGCYYADTMYRHKEAPSFKSFAAAARAGNPDSIVAWNPGIFYPPVEMDVEEDYTAGEVDDVSKLDHYGRWTGREQYQVLTYLGNFWCRGPVRYSSNEVASIVKQVNAFGGVVTWDLPINQNGLIHQDCFESLRGLNNELRKIGPTPKVPSNRITVTKRPKFDWDGKSAEGALSVELRNPWDTELSGKLVLGSDPTRSIEFIPTPYIEYSLAPAETKKHVIKIAMSSEYELGQRVQIEASYGDWRPLVKVPLLIESVIKTSEPDKTKTLFANLRGENYAEVRIGIESNGLLTLRFKIKDRVFTRSATPYLGSCVELFVAETPEEKIHQYFLVPEPSEKVGGTVITAVSNKEVPANATYHVKQTAEGYESMAQIPLSWLLDTKRPPNKFMVALSVTTGDGYGKFIRVGLFGTEYASTSTAGYSTVVL